MTTALTLSWIFLLVTIAWALWQRHQRIVLAREQAVRRLVFPKHVLDEFAQSRPEIQPRDVHLVARALRQFFLVHLRAKGALVSMPSKLTDELWHAFILDTRAYEQFCRAAFGKYFHHLPNAKMALRPEAPAALWRTWKLACLEENIRPSRASRLPLLFAIDAKLGLVGAANYDPASFKPPPRESSSSGGGDFGVSIDADSGCGGGCGGD